MRFSIVLLLLMLVPLGCAPSSMGPVAKKNAASWSPPANLLSQLGAAQEFDGYTIQLPAEFAKEKTIRTNFYVPDGFAGKPRENGTRASITVSKTDIIQSDKPLTNLGVLMQMIDGIKDRRSNFEESPPEIGMIGSVEFAKKTWTGTESKMQIPAKGSLYCAVVGEQYVTISVQDVADAGDEQFALAEASALTFKAK